MDLLYSEYKSVSYSVSFFLITGVDWTPEPWTPPNHPRSAPGTYFILQESWNNLLVWDTLAQALNSHDTTVSPYLCCFLSRWNDISCMTNFCERKQSCHNQVQQIILVIFHLEKPSTIWSCLRPQKSTKFKMQMIWQWLANATPILKIKGDMYRHFPEWSLARN